jgi:hypothetical protein
MSLSRTVPVTEHQIKTLLKDVRRELRHQRRVSVECKRMEVFVNDDRTRTFLALALQEPSQVQRLPSVCGSDPSLSGCEPLLWFALCLALAAARYTVSSLKRVVLLWRRWFP